jgi:hypothetical protein
MEMIGIHAEVVTRVRVVRHGVVVLAFADGLEGEVDLLDELWGPVFERARTPGGVCRGLCRRGGRDDRLATGARRPGA